MNYKKKCFWGILLLLVMNISSVTALSAPGDLGEPRSSYNLGSAKTICGKNLILSLFVDTPQSSFDEKTKEETLNNLHLACEYLKTETQKYDNDAEFIYNWKEDPALCYSSRIFMEPQDGEKFENYLDKKIDFWTKYFLNTHIKDKSEKSLYVKPKINKEKEETESLAEGYTENINCYNADNIFTIVFFNIDGRAYAITYDGIDSVNETLIAYADSSPSVLAHEILHLYGAHDFYEGAEYTKEVTTYLRKTYPNDIMLKVNESKQIKETIGKLTAYHLGLINEATDIKKYAQLIR